MKLKQVPEDFIVKEIANVSFSTGKHAYCLLRKKEWNTMDAVREIANTLKIDYRKASYAGIKDKKAVTEQYVSFEGVSKEQVEKVQIKDIELIFQGYSNERMNTELLVGNGFKITLRGLEKEIRNEIKFIPNYFDEQRFGTNARNHKAGKAIVKREFAKACELMDIRIENEPIASLMKKRDLLVLCFNAYQSYLFNCALAEYVKKHASNVLEVKYNAGTMAFGDLSNVKNIAMPLVHFDTEYENDEVKHIYEKVLHDEEIRLSDFLVRQLPNLIQSSPSRMAFAAVKDYATLEYSDDELNEGKKKQVIAFSLPKGSYGTIVVKALESLQ